MLGNLSRLMSYNRKKQKLCPTMASASSVSSVAITNITTYPTSSSSSQPSRTANGPLSPYEHYLTIYQSCPNLSEDENFMDIVMIITRTSKLRQGSMGCIIVKPSTQDMPADTTNCNDAENKTRKNATIDDATTAPEANNHTDYILGRIIAAATNTSLFKEGDSDVHAEINAIGQVAKQIFAQQSHDTQTTNGIANSQTHQQTKHPTMQSMASTLGATAYITMPPCKKCFGALYASGITRIVSRKPAPQSLLGDAAEKTGIEMGSLTREQGEKQRERLDYLFSKMDS